MHAIDGGYCIDVAIAFRVTVWSCTIIQLEVHVSLLLLIDNVFIAHKMCALLVIKASGLHL